jgi:hypothetical protein
VRYKRVLVGLAVAGAAFGVATAVQASIPDSDGVVHACYTSNNLPGYPPGTLRAIDTAKINGHCGQNEAPVDLATPQYVQSVVTSTINQTSFMIAATATGGPAFLTGNFSCGPGYISTDDIVGPTDNTAASGAKIDLQDTYNVGQVTGGVPDANGRLFATLTASVTFTIHGTCVDGRVYGLPGPVAPIKKAMSQAKITLSTS